MDSKKFLIGTLAGGIVFLPEPFSGTLVRFATENSSDRTSTLTNVLVHTLMTVRTGGIIGAILGMGKKSV